MIPDAWVKFEYHRDTRLRFEKLPFTPPNVPEEEFADLVFTTVSP
jgi:hypothetical protein